MLLRCPPWSLRCTTRYRGKPRCLARSPSGRLGALRLAASRPLRAGLRPAARPPATVAFGGLAATCACPTDARLGLSAGRTFPSQLLSSPETTTLHPFQQPCPSLGRRSICPRLAAQTCTYLPANRTTASACIRYPSHPPQLSRRLSPLSLPPIAHLNRIAAPACLRYPPLTHHRSASQSVSTSHRGYVWSSQHTVSSTRYTVWSA